MLGLSSKRPRCRAAEDIETHSPPLATLCRCRHASEMPTGGPSPTRAPWTCESWPMLRHALAGAPRITLSGSDRVRQQGFLFGPAVPGRAVRSVTPRRPHVRKFSSQTTQRSTAVARRRAFCPLPSRPSGATVARCPCPIARQRRPLRGGSAQGLGRRRREHDAPILLQGPRRR